MPPIDKRAALANHALFGHLAVADREQLLALGAERRFHDGQMIFQRGDAGTSMMLVLRGQVKISIVSSEGKELIFGFSLVAIIALSFIAAVRLTRRPVVA